MGPTAPLALTTPSKVCPHTESLYSLSQQLLPGSAVNVFGTTNINNSSGTIDPTWECFIDAVSIGSTSPFQHAENNWLLCTWNNNGPAQGSHVLTAKSTGHNFWFDWLQYEPPQSASVQNAVVYINPLDAAIKFDSSWQSVPGGSANMTTKEGSTLTLDFIGAHPCLLPFKIQY